MELYRDMLCKILETENYEIYLPDLEIEVEKLIELKSYLVLNEIKKILENPTQDDAECFECIEKIIALFEKIGSGIHNRHDFG